MATLPSWPIVVQRDSPDGAVLTALEAGGASPAELAKVRELLERLTEGKR